MLSEGEVHVWQGTASRHTAYADWAMLSPQEHERWRRLPPVAAAYYAGCHATMRRILGRYLSTPPVSVRLGLAAGRPIVHTADDPLWFSLSHSGPHWMLALSRYLLGVDIQCERPVDIEALEDLALSKAERRTVAEHDKAERRELFFRCWTRKEAVFKAAGAQRFAGLTNVDTYPERQGDVVVRCASRAGEMHWLVRSLEVGDRQWAAVASPAYITGRIVHRSWPSSLVPASATSM